MSRVSTFVGVQGAKPNKWGYAPPRVTARVHPYYTRTWEAI